MYILLYIIHVHVQMQTIIIIKYSLTGKKSPVNGKWKEFYFHLKCSEQKLLYYDNERVS